MAQWGAAAVGAVVWTTAAIVGGVTGRLGLIGALLALAVLVLVPLGLPMLGLGDRTTRVAVVTGAPAVAALMVGHGTMAVALAVPWAGLAGALAVAAGLAWWSRDRSADGLVRAVALGYLTVGALWLLADRAALEPAGFAAPFVVLTAVHFHHAGFVATTIVAAGRGREGRAADVATALVVAAPPVVAVGFLASPALQVLGALLYAVGLAVFATGVLRVSTRDIAGWSLRVAGIAVVVPMALAAHWATGTATGLVTPLDIGTMAATHGVLQAVGFGLVGLVGRRLAGHRVGGSGGAGDRVARDGVAADDHARDGAASRSQDLGWRSPP